VAGELKVGCVGRGDNKQVERRISQHFVERTVGDDARIALGNFVGRALQGRGQLEPFD